MRLTRFTDNALRCLIFLALEPGRHATARDIAARMGMSEDHLFKVIARLADLGYVETQRGRSGGVRLLRRPDDLRVGDVVRDAEDNMALVECFTPQTNRCPIAPACVLAGTLDKALAAFLGVLDGVSLADLTSRRRKLLALLAE